MLAQASGKRDANAMSTLLLAPTNDEVSPPAPAHGLMLEQVTYPQELYVA
jgi:tRNA U38,U39,U40 pseudouridine synthase TruA